MDGVDSFSQHKANRQENYFITKAINNSLRNRPKKTGKKLRLEQEEIFMVIVMNETFTPKTSK